MCVCVCQAVTDRQIREAAEGGARKLKDLRPSLPARSQCRAGETLRAAIAYPWRAGGSAGSANQFSLFTTTLFFGCSTKFGDMIWTP